jgi:hypothetical protein
MYKNSKQCPKTGFFIRAIKIWLDTDEDLMDRWVGIILGYGTALAQSKKCFCSKEK